MNKDKLFSFMSELTNEDITKYKNNFFYYMSLNGAYKKTVYGLLFSECDVNSGLFEEMIKIFSPARIYSGNCMLLDKVKELGYTSTLDTYYEGGGFMTLFIVPMITGSIVMDRGLIKNVKVK